MAATVIVSDLAANEQLSIGTIAGAVVGYFAYSTLFVFVAGLLVGVPIVWVLRRLSMFNLPVLVAAGFLSGGAVSWLILSGGGNRDPLLFLVGAFSGSAAAITWWWITERKGEPYA